MKYSDVFCLKAEFESCLSSLTSSYFVLVSINFPGKGVFRSLISTNKIGWVTTSITRKEAVDLYRVIKNVFVTVGLEILVKVAYRGFVLM